MIALLSMAVTAGCGDDLQPTAEKVTEAEAAALAQSSDLVLGLLRSEISALSLPVPNVARPADSQPTAQEICDKGTDRAQDWYQLDYGVLFVTPPSCDNRSSKCLQATCADKNLTLAFDRCKGPFDFARISGEASIGLEREESKLTVTATASQLSVKTGPYEGTLNLNTKATVSLPVQSTSSGDATVATEALSLAVSSATSFADNAGQSVAVNGDYAATVNSESMCAELTGDIGIVCSGIVSEAATPGLATCLTGDGWKYAMDKVVLCGQGCPEGGTLTITEPVSQLSAVLTFNGGKIVPVDVTYKGEPYLSFNTTLDCKAREKSTPDFGGALTEAAMASLLYGQWACTGHNGCMTLGPGLSGHQLQFKGIDIGMATSGPATFKWAGTPLDYGISVHAKAGSKDYFDMVYHGKVDSYDMVGSYVDYDEGAKWIWSYPVYCNKVE